MNLVVISEHPDFVLVEIDGMIVSEEHEYFEQMFENLKKDKRLILLNLSRVTFVDSVGLRMLIGLYKEVVLEQKRDILVSPHISYNMKKIFDLLGINKLFNISFIGIGR